MSSAELWGLVVSCVALLCAIAAFLRNGRSDSTADGQWRGSIDAKLDNLTMEVKSIGGIDVRISVLEHRVDAAFERIGETNARSERNYELIMKQGGFGHGTE